MSILKKKKLLLVFKSNSDPTIFSVLSSSNDFYKEIISRKL